MHILMAVKEWNTTQFTDTVENKKTFSLQVACISVTVFVRLRRAVQGSMNHHVVLRMQVDTLRRSSEGTKDLKQSRMFNINLHKCMVAQEILKRCKVLLKRYLSHFKPVFPFTPNSNLRLFRKN